MVIILMGVSGSGKTTVGQLLARDLGWPFYEGDDFHSPANVVKMEQGIALTDEDRRVWLRGLRQLIEGVIERRQNAVLACSALKKSYREQLRCGDVRFVYLKGELEVLRQRLEQRKGHFAKEDLLPSQFAVLEEPQEALTADVSQKPVEIVDNIKAELSL